MGAGAILSHVAASQLVGCFSGAASGGLPLEPRPVYPGYGPGWMCGMPETFWGSQPQIGFKITCWEGQVEVSFGWCSMCLRSVLDSALVVVCIYFKQKDIGWFGSFGHSPTRTFKTASKGTRFGLLRRFYWPSLIYIDRGALFGCLSFPKVCFCLY